MTHPDRTLLRAAVAAFALLATIGDTRDSSAQRSPSSAHCPRHRPAEGSACTAPTSSCSWGCGNEGSYDWTCRCVQSGAAAVWRCERGALCGS